MSKKIKRLSFLTPIFITAFILGLSGCTTYYGQPPYSANYIQPSSGYVSVGVAEPTFAFSVGTGVSAYYYPTLQTYLYLYNGSYYRWFNGGWVYARGYTGPWYSIPPTMVLPEPLLYGPPPPVVHSQPYFHWWKSNVGTWYRTNHPEWWTQHQTFLRNYNSWNNHVSSYRTHPGDLYPRNENRNNGNGNGRNEKGNNGHYR